MRACRRRHGLVKNRVCFKFAFGCAFSRAFLAAFAAARLRNAVVRIFESRGADCVLYFHPYRLHTSDAAFSCGWKWFP